MESKRIQRKRLKGWKMPENTIYVGRPSKWGNPFKIGAIYYPDEQIILHPFNPKYEIVKDLNHSLELYESHLKREVKFGRLNLYELKDKKLACWCHINNRCHVDIILNEINKLK